MDRMEAWEHIIAALRDHFSSEEWERGEWDIAVNNTVGTITLIHNPTRGVMALTDTTGSHYGMDNWNIIMPTGELEARLHGHRWRVKA